MGGAPSAALPVDCGSALVEVARRLREPRGVDRPSGGAAEQDIGKVRLTVCVRTLAWRRPELQERDEPVPGMLPVATVAEYFVPRMEPVKGSNATRGTLYPARTGSCATPSSTTEPAPIATPCQESWPCNRGP